jgi:hypothetical protein
VNEMTVKDKIVHTIRDVIEEKRLYLLSHKDKSNWEDIKKVWNRYYKLNFNASTEDVYLRLKEVGVSSLHLVELRCELCDEYFDLDEQFIEIVIDHGGWDDVSITFHPKCMEVRCKVNKGE